MTLHLFSVSVTIKRREISLEQAIRQEQIEKLYEKSKEHQAMMHYFSSNGL
ncbi:YrzI family small protein [Neobacillus sp. K501]